MSNLENNTTKLEELLEMAYNLPPVGQGGSAALIVRATEVDEEGFPTKLSHSFEEIIAAANAGLVVIAEVEGIYF